MLLFYRLAGVVADIALLLYVMLLLLVMRYLGATLTLPGIAGIILSVGMAVDANVLIFERFKEEVKRGKTLRSAMDSGFGRAIVTILDSNLTTIMLQPYCSTWAPVLSRALLLPWHLVPC